MEPDDVLIDNTVNSFSSLSSSSSGDEVVGLEANIDKLSTTARRGLPLEL